MLGMDGALLIDKPAGLTSHDVVAQVRHILHQRRVGHTGTLDPFATGLLVILVGRATRLAQFLSGVEKEYEAVIRLGFATDTGDLTGKPLSADSQQPSAWSADEIEAALASLRGKMDQIPPMYSAKKQRGQKLYELARRGEEVERKPVRVSIHEFESMRTTGGTTLLRNNLDGTFDLRVRVACSAGTYVRTLAEDFGKRLNVGAHLAELRRTRVGDFEVRDGITLEQLKMKSGEEALGTILLSPDQTLSRLPALDLSAEDVARVRNGIAINAAVQGWETEERVRMRDEHGQLVGVGIFDKASGLLRPAVVISRNEIK